MMRSRISSTLILFAIVAWMLNTMGLWGGILLLILCSTLTQWELYQLMEKMGWKPHKKSAVICGIMILLKSCFVRDGIIDLNYALSAFVFMITIFAIVTVMGKPEDLKNIFLPTIFGILYVPVMFCIPLLFINKLSLITGSHLPLTLVLWIITVAKFSDIGGLVIGSRWGRHKLAPLFSPAKTYEGLLGSLLFSIAIAYIFAFCCAQHWPSSFSKIKIGIVSAFIAVIALISDLIESGLKRLAGAKDSGHSIPGIGGMFDLMDSLILSLPMGVIIIHEFVLS
ncbi:MAG: phosphatidate cytidylyltransferase [Puniceicoccales bacterium]|jgi:phosphatidate cytidylyltransferase|nr:phosphatidate cytidylyltransferase [Puniceicoccales bacterium]